MFRRVRWSNILFRFQCDICGTINSFPTKTPDGQLSQAWPIKDNGEASLKGGRYEVKN